MNSESTIIIKDNSPNSERWKSWSMENINMSLPKVFRKISKYNTKCKKINKKQYEQYKKAKEILHIDKQHGGEIRKVSIIFRGIKYNFIYEKDEDLYSMFDKNDDSRCIMMSIDKDSKTASIENINGDYEGCPNGSLLLDASIKFLEVNKKEFGIDKITLSDISLKSCHGFRLKFCDMYMLTHGKTWYFAHGLVPVDKKKYKELLDTEQIIKNTPIYKITNLKKYIDIYGKEIPDDFYDKIQMIKNKSVMILFNKILSKYEKKWCKFYFNIYEKIMKDLNIKSFYGTIYLKQL